MKRPIHKPSLTMPLPRLTQDTPQLNVPPGPRVNSQRFSSSNKTPSVPHRLPLVEGLRAYLVLWALAAHAFWAAGYESQWLSGLPKLLLLGHDPAYVAVIISGFVIFLSLDTQRETYQQFIVRRFFRLFPVFIVLF